ncbi:unnamed protein product [Calicophoron daubneyi]|uniref:Uncharacterized protein n=1 Tax=Calicophoron daubneyi TaxID=300641 RepID=A0AAV2T7U6_CALDB
MQHRKGKNTDETVVRTIYDEEVRQCSNKWGSRVVLVIDNQCESYAVFFVGQSSFVCLLVMGSAERSGWKANSFEEYLLKYTLEHLLRGINHNITENEKELRTLYCKALSGDQVNLQSRCEESVIEQKTELLQGKSELVASATEDVRLLRHILAYAELVESALIKSKLRSARLREENSWLQDELKNFAEKNRSEEQRVDSLCKRIAHSAFLYYQRHNRNDDLVPFVVSDASQDTAVADDHSTKLEKVLSAIRPHLAEANRLDKKIEEPLMAKEPVAQPSNPGGVFGGASGSGDDSRENLIHVTSNVLRPNGENSSNSTKLTLTELRDLMLGDSTKDARKQSETGMPSRKGRTSLVSDKQSKLHKEMLDDCIMSDLEKETLKQCMKTLEPDGQVSQRSTGKADGSLQDYVERFIRSSRRSDKLNMFIDLVGQFNHKEMHSPGIGLCSMAINVLKACEHELRLGKRGKSKQAASTSTAPTPKEAVVSTGDPEYISLVNDLCKLLNVASLMYKSRNEMSKAAECLKDLLKIRRSTKTWKQPSVAAALTTLSSIQSSMKDHNSAIANARKALQLRREILNMGENVVDMATGQLAIAKQATSLALMLMYKNHSEQKRLRYHRFPFREATEIPSLLNEAVRTQTTLSAHIYPGGLPLFANDWDSSVSEKLPSTIGDSLRSSGSPGKLQLNPIQYCLTVSRIALSIYYISARKWMKAQKQLNMNLSQLNNLLPEVVQGQPSNISRSALHLTKITCLKCLLYICRSTDQSAKAGEVTEQITQLDPIFRMTDEIVEEDMIRMCQDCLLSAN